MSRSVKARPVLFYDFDGSDPVALPLATLDHLAVGMSLTSAPLLFSRFQAWVLTPAP